MKWALLSLLVAVSYAAVLPGDVAAKLSAVVAHSHAALAKQTNDAEQQAEAKLSAIINNVKSTLNKEKQNEEPKISVEKHLEEAPAVPPLNEASIGYALDLSASTPLSTFQCIRQQGYAVVFVRGYNPSGNGAYDPNGALNVKNAVAAGLGAEVYMTPQPASSKSASQQIDELYTGITNGGVTLRTIWIQVTSPINWPNSQATNQAFISSLVSRAKQYNLAVGIYTNTYDWNQITNAWNNLPGTSLWYWSVNGNGPSGETSPNFTDFRAFGCWTSAAVKQFGQAESVCGVAVNRDVYMASVSEKAEAVQENGKIVAGNNIKML